jgi:cytochrome oxidase assembly protein ShyY1
MDGPDLGLSIVVVALAAVVAGLANWQLRRPADRRLWPAVPWLGVQFVAVAFFLIFAAHLVTLLSGRHFSGRGGY